MTTLVLPRQPSRETVLGSVTPRLWTPPLRELTPETSYGFEVCDFARDTLGEPLDPWQEWTVIHLGELLPDGRPRFRTVLILVARQNGKTHLLKVLTLWWLYADLPIYAELGRRRPTVLGTSSKLDYARESWSLACETAKACELVDEIAPRGIRETNGEQHLVTTHGTRYKIAAANGDAGRSLTISRLVLDELRQHHDWETYNAATPTTNAIPDAQIICLSNQGDQRAVVLHSLRKSALDHIKTGRGDWRLGLFEYSAPKGADPCDPHALAAANPQYGRRIDPDSLLGDAARAKAAGGLQLRGFQIEIMCQEVDQLDPAIDPRAWADSATDDPADLAYLRQWLAACWDVSLDGEHAILVAAAQLGDDQVAAEVVECWTGANATADMRAALPSLITRVRPRVVGWYPDGPGAAMAAQLADPKAKATARRGRAAWPPKGVRIQPITADTPAVCMGLAELVKAGQLQRPECEVLDAHIGAAARLQRGDRWVFARRDVGAAGVDPAAGPINGAYALAGAVHLARTLPPPPGKPRIVTARERVDPD